MRAVRFVLALAAVLLLVLVVGAGLFLHLAATGKSPPLTKALALRLGEVMRAQRVEHVFLDVQLRAAARELEATVRLQVRAAERGRHYLYFLLNPGLRVHEAWREEKNGRRIPLLFHRFGPLTVLDMERNLEANEVVQVALRYAGTPLAGGKAPYEHGVLSEHEVILLPESFWYPTDLQGFFMVDAKVALPEELVLVHNGKELGRTRLGNVAQVSWVTPRPVPSLALVAGLFRESTRSVQEQRYRLLTPPGEFALDTERILTSLAEADRLFTEMYGASGLAGITLFVCRTLDHPFSDGSGLIGISAEEFRRGDHGIGAIAHEVAHNWFGGSIAERPLQPGTGGQWLVEGFAEFSSWLAVEAQLGEGASVRLRNERFFDPRRAPALRDLSLLDNWLEPRLRTLIPAKGAYVTSLLRQAVGHEAFVAAVKELMRRFRYSRVRDLEAEEVFSEVAHQDLSQFFSAWVRSDTMFDVALEDSEGGAAVRSRASAPAPAQLELWRFPPDGNPERQSVEIDSTTPLGNAEYLVLDPLLRTPDMYRESNVLPRRANPRAVARSARGELLIAYGEPYPWAPATVAHVDVTGRVLHTWEFPQGAGNPAWTADGTRMLVVEADPDGMERLAVLSAIDGNRRRLRFSGPATGTSGVVLVAQNDQIVRVVGKAVVVVLRRTGWELGNLLASPDGQLLAYMARRRGAMELRLAQIDGADDRLLFSWPRGSAAWVWANDGSRLFAVLPGDWDWQLWEVPIRGERPRALVREAAAITSVVTEPAGHRVAFIAAAEIDYGHERREVFVLDLLAGGVQRFNLESRYGHELAWLDPNALLVIVSDPITPAVPRRRELVRLILPEGRLLPFP